MKVEYRNIIKLNKITERSSLLRELNNEYVFEVDKAANKLMIKSAVEDLFKVKVVDVRTLIMPGKIRRMGRNEGKTSTWKKAIVRLKKGESITMFDNL
ncbi:MAG TPA: 50S ribosomal protein L23 [Candidatus Marinimicrobia bacterium]|nr:50S ribosomal protein L23 [Candidatus Neomarinimicrobiota bacterium]